MSKTLFIAALFMVIIWAVGFWGYHQGPIIHITLLFAALFLIMSFSLKKNLSRFLRRPKKE